MPQGVEAIADPWHCGLGYTPASAWEERNGPADRFMADYRSKTELNRRILNHLLHDAFSGDAGQAVDPIVDLVLDPEPSSRFIRDVLSPYPFLDHRTAYHNLMALAREDFPFLSQARCRHFLGRSPLGSWNRWAARPTQT